MGNIKTPQRRGLTGKTDLKKYISMLVDRNICLKCIAIHIYIYVLRFFQSIQI